MHEGQKWRRGGKGKDHFALNLLRHRLQRLHAIGHVVVNERVHRHGIVKRSEIHFTHVAHQKRDVEILIELAKPFASEINQRGRQIDRDHLGTSLRGLRVSLVSCLLVAMKAGLLVARTHAQLTAHPTPQHMRATISSHGRVARQVVVCAYVSYALAGSSPARSEAARRVSADSIADF